MPLYVADYETRAPLIMHAASPEHALAMLETIKEEPPRAFHEVPDGTFIAELYVEDDDSEVESYAERDEIPNPANHSQVGYAIEPLEAFADWLTLMLATAERAAADVATAPTEPEQPAAPFAEDSEP